MQDYAKLLLTAINQYDANNAASIDRLRDLVCWISDHDELKQDAATAELLYIASQKMRVFGYNTLNGFTSDPSSNASSMDDIGSEAIQNLYQSNCNKNVTLDKTQKEVVDFYQSLSPRRMLVSAPTSYGKTFLIPFLLLIAVSFSASYRAATCVL